MQRLTIAALETASWIARLGSFTAAANRLNTTQPAISTRIRELEQILGFKLFVRHRRGVEVTLEGRDFLRQAEPLLVDLENLANAAVHPPISGKVRLGTSSIALGLVARLSQLIRREMPLLSLEVRTGAAGLLLDDVEAGRSDLAIVTGQVELARYLTLPLASNELIWAISTRLFDQHRADSLPALFQKLPVWCIGQGSYSWGATATMLRGVGVELGAINELPSAVALTKIIAEDGGLGYISRTCSELELASGLLMMLPGLEPEAQVSVSMVCRHDRASHQAVARIMGLAATLIDRKWNDQQPCKRR